MAQLKSTVVQGALTVTGNAVATKVIKNGGTSDQILMADGSTSSKSEILGLINAAVVLKGTLGTGGTITSLPTAVVGNLGYAYKVITAGTYASQAAKVGDMFICWQSGTSSYAWMLIPSGDDIEDTWRPIKLGGTQILANGNTTNALNFIAGTNVGITNSNGSLTFTATDTTYGAEKGIALSSGKFGHSNSVTAVTSAGFYKFKYDAYGHITGTTAVTKADLTGLGVLASESDTLQTVTTRGATTDKAITTAGLTTTSGYVNITGVSGFSEGIRLHPVGNLSSIWWNATTDKEYCTNGMWGITAYDYGYTTDTSKQNTFRFRGPTSSSATSPTDQMWINSSGLVTSRGGFAKSGSSNSYVLLAGGGTKAVSDFAASSNLGNYLPLAGGTLTGTLGFKSTYLIKPVADYVSSTPSVSGAITINLPASIGNTMISLWIDVYNYVEDTSFSVHVGGYTYNNSTWEHRPSVMVYGANHKVRLGHNGTNFVIYIGELNSSWSYPQISVRNVLLGYGGTYANWYKDWTINFTTDSFKGTKVIEKSDKVWTTKNDGASSGLDADLLDGQQGSYYLNYNNFTNKPTIPAAQIQSDWNQTNTSKLDYIKNKPTIPTVNNGTLTIQKNGSTVATFTANQSGNTTANITVPNPTDYYWANIKVSSSSSTATTPSVQKIGITGSTTTTATAAVTMEYDSSYKALKFVFA